ncbi:hypothetical protein VA596_41700 [Amycolatopsis sp., V23-08]|uniref:Porin n=1 Tax=Amycolatopsis heterodermiae TaxID=3110235 RepID=A0ABU5RIJ2_9PSEU|nr:hypothetical protein [Amycolatopsis sp., V23-08]MEA5366102.1 hypothetical protein [Amycolatopsis sp., V23-08]
MGKESGLGARFFVGGYDLSGDIGSLDNISSPRGLLDTTGIDKLANERIYGTKDGGMEFSSYFNPDTIAGGQTRNGAHVVLSALPTADIGVMYAHRATLGVPAACMIGKQLNYDPTRGADGSLAQKTSVQANGYGLEWGKLLTAGVRTDIAATNGASLDGGASSAFGLQAYLQVFGFTGTDATVKLQDSADNASWADLTGGAFAAVTTAPGSQRLQTGRAATVRRYLRAITVTTGGFSSLAFAVAVTRNPVAVTF